MSSWGELLANKRRIAVFLIIYAIVFIVVIAVYLGKTKPSVALFSQWVREGFQSDNSYVGIGQYSFSGLATIAIGGGITSKGSPDLSENNMETTMPLFTEFIPGFCRTASQGFYYRFYFAYDQSDRLFNDPKFLSAFKNTFQKVFRSNRRNNSSCTAANLNVSVSMVKCNHDGKPTWAQNDAMMEAYLDNVDYHYRINDDTKMITPNWVESFIGVLQSYVPTHVGVVGPKHSGGNIDILTYDFVHRTHVDIFGFYYPRLFTDWWGDDWITKVYEPYRSTKLRNVLLEHTMGSGRRYHVHKEVALKLKAELDKDQEILQRYINYTESKDSIKVDGRKVISMSLYGRDSKYLWGAIRNAQLAPIFFPGWKLRFYVISQNSSTSDVKLWSVPKRILKKLKQLGAELAYVENKSIPPVFWRYLVVDDSGIDYFIVRNAHNRLSERDAIAVNEWLQRRIPNQDLSSFHCIRDHPDHVKRSIVDGLWGGYREGVRRTVKRDMETVLIEYVTEAISSKTNVTTSRFLERTLWPLVSSFAYCHDSVSCDKWPGVHMLPTARRPGEYLGQDFDEHNEPISPFNVSEHALICKTNASPVQLS